MGQSKDATLAVPAYGYGAESCLMQPILGQKAVMQQIVKSKPYGVRTGSVPGQVQCRNGKTCLPQGSEQSTVLERRKHSAGVKQYSPGTGIGPDFQLQFTPIGGCKLVGDDSAAHTQLYEKGRPAPRGAGRKIT